MSSREHKRRLSRSLKEALDRIGALELGIDSFLLGTLSKEGLRAVRDGALTPRDQAPNGRR